MRRWISSFGLPQTGDVSSIGGIASTLNRDAAYQALGQEGSPSGLTGMGFAFRRGNKATPNYLAQIMGQGGLAPTVNSFGGLEHIRMRIRRLPTVEEQIYALTDNGAGSFYMLSLDPNGIIRAYNNAGVFPGALLYACPALALNTWYQLILTYLAQGAAPGGVPAAQLIFNLSINSTGAGAAPISFNEATHSAPVSNPAFTQSLWGAEARVNVNNGLELDFADWIMDDLGNTVNFFPPNQSLVDRVIAAGFRAAMRVEVRRPAGLGSYQNWTTSGITAIQARQGIPPDSTAGGGINILTSAVAKARVTYAFGTLATMGLTGPIRAFRLAVYYASGAGTHNLIWRRNGVDVLFPVAVNTNTWATVVIDVTDTTIFPLLAPLDANDTIEVGVEKDNSVTSASIQGVALEVETDGNPIPAQQPDPTDNTIRVAWGEYNGNSTGQQIAVGFCPEWVSIVPIAGSTGDGSLWCDQDVGAPGHADSRVIGTRMAQLLANGFAVGGSDGFCNVSGTTYAWVAIRDPQNRCLLRGSFTHTPQDAQVTNPYVDPAFSPLAIWAKNLNWQTSIAAGNGVYRGPGHVGQNSSPLAGAQVTTGIIAMAAGSFDSGTALHLPSAGGVVATYTAWRISGFVNRKLWNAISYVGDGTGNRNIAIDLSGSPPIWAMCLPHNGAGYIRPPGFGDTSSCLISSASLTPTVTVGIIGGAPNTVQVGSALNAVGVVYELLAIAGLAAFTSPGPGNPPPTIIDLPFIPPPTGGCSSTLPVPVAGGGSGCAATL